MVTHPLLVTVEAKGISSYHDLEVQNKHDISHMLRGLQELRSRVGVHGWQREFYGQITVVSVSILNTTIGLYRHWAEQVEGHAVYCSHIMGM